MNELQIDPGWAWATFEPDAETPWDHLAAAHLMRRAGFGATADELDEAIATSPAECVERLVTATEPPAFKAVMDRLIDASLAGGNPQSLAAQWVYRMLATPAPLREKMTLFWHGHFATSAAKVDDAELMQQQNDLLRKHALGDFSQLTLEISRDPAMLLYLDSASNRKAHPNENYARELMELFCLGEGQYSEDDIRELARCFTGWEIKRKRFRLNRYQHDNGVKTVLGTSGEMGGEEGVAVVLQQPATASFLASKLIRFFVMDQPLPSAALVEPLAEQLRNDGLQTGPTVKKLLSSNLFFSRYARGRKIKSPVEFGIGFLRSLEGTTDAYQMARALEDLGQGLYYPPSVKGWDGGRSWINSSTLLGRANLIQRLVHGGKTRFGKQSLDEYLMSEEIRSSEDLTEYLQRLLFAVPVPPHAKERIAETPLRVGKQGSADLENVVRLLCTLPEFQLS